jgi:hypothetical protein
VKALVIVGGTFAAIFLAWLSTVIAVRFWLITK